MTKSFSPARVRVVLAVAVAALIGLGAGRLTPTILQAAAADAIYFLMTLGDRDRLPTSPVQFTFPQGVAYDSAGRLYVTDTEGVNKPTGNRVQVFGLNNEFLYEVVPTSAPFVYPVGLAIDSTNRLVVADADNHRIVVFRAGTALTAGTELAAVGVYGNFDDLDPDRQPGSPTLDPLTLYSPTGVAVKPGTRLLDTATPDTAGRVAIADNGNHRIVVLDADLQPLYDFGGHSVGGLDTPYGTLEYPWGVAIDSAGQYYIADSENNRVQVFKEVVHPTTGVKSAQFVRVFGSSFVPGAVANTFDFGADPGDIARPYGLNFDSKGRLLLADPDNHRVMRIDVTANVPLPVNPTYCKDVESDQSENHCIITTSDGQRYDAMVLGALGGGEDALFLYPQSIVESPSKGLAVADTDNDVVQLFGAKLLSLNFVGAGTVDPGPRVLQQPFTFSVTVQNDGDLLAQGLVTPTTSSAGYFTPASRSTAIAPGFSQVFAFTFTPGEPGPVSIVVTASGTAAVLAGGQVEVGTQVLNGGVIPQGIGLSGTATVSGLAATPIAGQWSGGVNDTFTVAIRLRNTGTTPLTNVRTVMGISSLALVQLVGSAPAATSLAGLAQTSDLVYTYRMVQAGTVVLTPSGSADYVGATEPLSATIAAITVNIFSDVKAPTSTITLPVEPASGWYKAQIPVTVTAVDEAGGSGVKTVTYRMVQANPVDTVVTGGSATFTVIRQGITEIRYFATDNAGNVEATRSVLVKLDSVAPVMGSPQVTVFTGTPQESAAIPASGWYTSNPTITFIAGDTAGGSNLASLTPPALITANGANQTRTGVAVDNAGNVSTEASATVAVDKIAPTIVCGPTVLPTGLNGWYKAGTASVTFKCDVADQPLLSGIAVVRAFCPVLSGGTGTTTPVQTGGAVKLGPTTASASCTITAEGVHPVYGEVVDVAGNRAFTQAINIKIDRTAPTVTCGTASGGEIWPPNHKMVLWNTSVLVSDLGSAPAGFKLTAFSSSEALNWKGDGNTKVDMTHWTLGTPDVSGYVRAERSGTGSGRNYRLLYEGMDGAGNVTACTNTLIGVPHDQGKK